MPETQHPHPSSGGGLVLDPTFKAIPISQALADAGISWSAPPTPPETTALPVVRRIGISSMGRDGDGRFTLELDQPAPANCYVQVWRNTKRTSGREHLSLRGWRAGHVNWMHTQVPRGATAITTDFTVRTLYFSHGTNHTGGPGRKIRPSPNETANRFKKIWPTNRNKLAVKFGVSIYTGDHRYGGSYERGAFSRDTVQIMTYREGPDWLIARVF